VKNNLPIFWVMAFSLVGMKCAILLNQSTITMIESNPLDGGKLTMKSMDTFSHNHLRIDNGRNNLGFFFFFFFLVFNFVGKSNKYLHIPLHCLSN
jgi:hypothetical protein